MPCGSSIISANSDMPFSAAAMQDLMPALILGMARMAAAFTLLPILGNQVLPGSLRNGVIASLSLVLLPMHLAALPSPAPGAWELAGLALKEVLIGLVLGYLTAVFFWALESAGFFIDNQRGATMASSIDPLTGSQTSPLAILLIQVLNAVFFLGGGFLVFIGALYKSYQWWPLFTFFPSLEAAAFGELLMGQVNLLMSMAVLLAAPLLLPMFLAEFALALISRAAPQLSVFFLAMPIKSALANLLLVLYLGLLIGYFEERLAEIGAVFMELGRSWR